MSLLLHRVSKNYAKLFLSELCQISTNCENFWRKDGKEDKHKLCEAHSFSTSPNLCQHTVVLKTHFLLCVLLTMFLCILQTFVMHSRSGAE